MLIPSSLQTVSISMYFGVSWLDPRLRINSTAPEWKEAKTGPKDVSSVPHCVKSGVQFS